MKLKHCTQKKKKKKKKLKKTNKKRKTKIKIKSERWGDCPRNLKKIK
jgi:hypothetical protein